jgi:NDP-mannose synthase
MKAFILAGGEGRRLKPYTSVLPKPLLPLGDKPILEIILKNLKDQGINDVILAINYKSSLFKMFFGDGSKLGMNINYSKEEKPLGTIGPIKLVEKEFDGNVIVMNGDILTDLDFNKLLEFHNEKNSDITVVSRNIAIPLEYGVIKSKDDKVIGWEEKPSLNSEVSAGIYVIKSSVIKMVEDDKRQDMPELILKVVNSGGNVFKFPYGGRWIDIGRISDYQRAESEMLETFKEK